MSKKIDNTFKKIGDNCSISEKASFYNKNKISIGDNVRIDDFCILSAGIGGIEIGNNIHIAAYSSLIGAGKITLQDFCNISSRVSIYSSNDDYSGQYMTNPTIPAHLTNVAHSDVTIGKHVIIGCGSVILPGVEIGEGSAIGALSLINKNCEPFMIYAGTPAAPLKRRSKALLSKEKQFKKEKSKKIAKQ
jgi:galactoside O-acetyltransferase